MDIHFQELSRSDMSISCLIIDSNTGLQIGSAEGYLSNFGSLVTVIKVNPSRQGHGIGFLAFDMVFSELSKKYSILEIVGGWHRGGEFSYCEMGMSTNLMLFNESINKGIDPITSAWNTPTGKWARRKGFTKCKINYHTSESVEVVFS